MASSGRLSATFSIFRLALCCRNVLAKDSQCLWTGWSPCTVTCASRGSGSVYSQQWQRYICKGLNNLDNKSITSRFRPCAHMIPLCVSGEGFSVSFQNYFFLAIFSVGMLLAFVPNMILGLRYMQVRVWKSRKAGQKSEKSVPSFKETGNNFLSNRN
uniref:Uncharacterized protein n=1 Tax=Setaria digitata TaxID=48799 RepID=A0A915Q6E0_9BILA